MRGFFLDEPSGGGAPLRPPGCFSQCTTPGRTAPPASSAIARESRRILSPITEACGRTFLVLWTESPSAFGDVERRGERIAPPLIREMSTPARQALGDIVCLGDEVDGRLVRVESFTVESGRAPPLGNGAVYGEETTNVDSPLCYA